MKCREIIEHLNCLAPEMMACSWDNPGLLAGRFEKEVKKIYLALDATDQVILAAAAAGADMLITHHPLIFKAVKKVNDGILSEEGWLRFCRKIFPIMPCTQTLTVRRDVWRIWRQRRWD